MEEFNADDRNSSEELSAILQHLWKNKIKIVCTTMIFAIGIVAYSLSLPNIYQSSAILASKSEDSQSVAQLSQMVGQFGGLANLAGLNLGTGQALDVNVATETMLSRPFFAENLYDLVVYDLMAATKWNQDTNEMDYDLEIYHPENDVWTRQVDPPLKTVPSVQEAHREFMKIFSVTKDPATGFVAVTIRFYSPFLAKAWLDRVITGINENTRRKDILEAENSIKFLNEQRAKTNLVSVDQVFSGVIEEQTKKMMLANVSEDYVFQVLEPPIASELKAGPNRALMCVLVTLLGGFIALAWVFLGFFLTKLEYNQ